MSTASSRSYRHHRSRPARRRARPGRCAAGSASGRPSITPDAGLAQRHAAPALAGEADGRHPDAHRVPGPVPVRVRRRGVPAARTPTWRILLPGLFAQMAMFATMGLGTALCEDIHKGVFDRFRSLPVARSAPLLGAVIGDSVRFFAVMAVLTGFGSALGFRFHASVPSILAAYGLAYVFYFGRVLGLGTGRPGRAVAADGAGHLVHLDHAAGLRQQRAAGQHGQHAGLAPGLGQGQPGDRPGRLGARADHRRPGRHAHLVHAGLGGRDRAGPFPVAMRMYARKL